MDDTKFTGKASYRINNRIRSIIDKTFKDIRKETGLKLSLGKVSRAFWVSLAADAGFRKKFFDLVYKMALEELDSKPNKYYYVRKDKPTAKKDIR